MALKIVSGIEVTSISLSSYLDLAKNELRNAAIQNLSTTEINAISSPVQGQFVYDSTLDKLKVYDGSAWVLVGAAPDDSTIELSSNTLSIKASGVGTSQIADDAVTAAKIDDNAVGIAALNVTDGTNGQVLVTNGSGTLSFQDQVDSDVSVDNLTTKLALISGNYSLGDATDVTATFSGGVTITGDLTVNGTTTTVNSTTTTLDDPIITLGGDTAPTSDDNKDRGVEFRYYDTAARIGFFGYDDSDRLFTAYLGASNESEVFNGTYAPAKFSDLTLTGGLNVATSITINGTAVTATAAELNILDGVTATATELNYVSGVDSAIQTQLDGKQPTITGAATTIDDTDLTVSRALVSNASGKVAVSAVTSTELGYLDGVTSAVQTQINSKPDFYSGSVTVSSGTGSVSFSTHGIDWPAMVQLYDSNARLVLADIQQSAEGENDITITASDATYTVVIQGAA
jgi:fructose-specific component phosphotransferase system IIB-like protein